jgi:hypothetical protein
MEHVLIMSKCSFLNNDFDSHLLQRRQNEYLCNKGTICSPVAADINSVSISICQIKRQMFALD